jgi:hypothetical protein
MAEQILIVDSLEGPKIVVLNFGEMSNEELSDYVILGIEEAVDEYYRRDPRIGLALDPYAPVEVPEN